MKGFVLIVVLVASCPIWASWYWPFGSDEETGHLRLSELVEPASLLIDEAADLAAEGKVDESVEKYRKALDELDRIEMENPERAKTAEFATVRNKRAYVNAAIDSMLLSQVKENAKAVAVSDTTELEEKLAAEKGKAQEKTKEKAQEKVQAKVKGEGEGEDASNLEAQSAKPTTKREQAMADIANGDIAAAELLISEMLAANPKSAMALNLKAALESKRGDFKAAETALDQAIASNPRSHFAYYNMAYLMLQKNPDAKLSARRYYETGRAMGGPEDPVLETLK